MSRISEFVSFYIAGILLLIKIDKCGLDEATLNN